MAEFPSDILLAPNCMVGPYRVQRLLGRGAMGDVYLARDTHLGRKVALKMVRTDALGDSEARKRFVHEARITARFSHPHIVTIYGVGEYEDCPYVALEYLDGETLRDRMNQERPGAKESLRIGLAIAEALMEAHQHNVLHRDLKPRNVLLPPDGRLRVLDFGLAKLLEDRELIVAETQPPPASGPEPSSDWLDGQEMDATMPVTRPASRPPSAPPPRTSESLLEAVEDGDEFSSMGGGLRGTPAYMAPEQWRLEEVGTAADIWALGVILYELFSGEHPYSFDDARQLGEEVSGPGTVPSLSLMAGELPTGIVDFVDDCLDKHPEVRPSAAAAVAALTQLLSDDGRRSVQVRSPFRGLLPFSERHADLFFGRDGEIAAFLERIREEPVLPIVGPSGAGKSSFVQAGVIPRLREQGRWMVIRLRPGTRPFRALAQRLLARETSSRSLSPDRDRLSLHPGDPLDGSTERAAAVERLVEELREAPTRLALRLGMLAEADRCRILLFVDQLEELYTLVSSESLRQKFMLALCTSADDPAGPVRTLFTLRDDFLWRLADGEEARDVLGRVTVLRPPSAATLLATLEQPLAKVGYDYEDPALPQQMVAEVQAEAVALPLLQFAAQRLWERRDQDRQLLTHAGYEAIGGVAGALARHADSSLETLPAAQVRVARELFLRLVTADNTRRVLSRSELLDGLGDKAEQTLEAFVAARTIVVRKGSAEAELELVHESLITQWGRLSQWLDESRDRREFLAQVGQAAALWDDRGCPADEVWTGEALAEALRRAAGCRTLPQPVERFLSAGKHQAERAGRRRRRLTAVGVGLLALVAVAAVMVGWALRAKEQEAQRQKRIAQDRGAVAERQRAEAQREGARAAYARGAMVETRAKLRGALESDDSPMARALWWRLSKDQLLWKKSLGATLYGIAFAPDGQRVAVASMDQTIHLIDTQTRQERVLRGHQDQVLAVAFSPMGGQLASATYGEQVWLWDLQTGQSSPLETQQSVARRLAFSPDGQLLAGAAADRRVRLWDTRTRRLRAVLEGHQGPVQGVCFSPDGRLVASASADQTVRLWEVAGGKPHAVLEGHQGSVLAVAFGPDGQLLASASTDRTVALWDVRARRRQAVLEGHRGPVHAVSFSPDGRRVASSSADETVRLWEVTPPRLAGVLEGHHAQVRDVAFGPDEGLLASVGWDQTIRLWDTSREGLRAVAQGHTAQVNGVAFSPDGQQVASGSVDKTVRIWSVATARTLAVLEGHTATVWGVSYSGDGQLLASGSSDKTVRLWDPRSGHTSRVLDGHRGQVWSVDFSPDGQRLASSSSDRTVRLWSTASGTTEMVLEGHEGPVWNVDFAPEGDQLASAGDDHAVRLWSPTEPRPPVTLNGHAAAAYDVRFGPKGRWLASASDDGVTKLWARRGGAAPLEQQVLGPVPGRAYSLDFDRAGRRLGVASSAGTGHLFDIAAQPARVTTRLRGHRGEVNALRFSPDGKLVATTGDDGTVRLWHADGGSPYWRAPLLRRAGPELFTHLGIEMIGPAARSGEVEAAWRAQVQEHAIFADESPDGAHVCVVEPNAVMAAWDTAADRAWFREPVPGLDRTVALPGGCVSLAAGTVRLHLPDEKSRLVAERASAIAWDRGQLLIAAGREVLVANGDGAIQSRHGADVGVTALAHVGDWLVLGFKDGGIELLGTRPDQPAAAFSFEDTPASPVVRLIAGPQGTVVAGYGNGLYGLWSMSNGIRLVQRRLHGPVIHLLLQTGRLYAASALGQHEMLNLEVFDLPYCDLLRNVWQQVPVVWRHGHPIREPSPQGHPCARPTPPI